jgi:hypothetical protein
MRIALLRKVLITTASLTFLQFAALAGPKIEKAEKAEKARPFPRFWIGGSMGINNPAGFLGIQTDVAINGKWSAGTGVGFSTWGTKTFLEGRYYPKGGNMGWAMAGGLTYNTGVQGFKTTAAETLNGENEVVINEDGQLNGMVSAYYFFKLGHRGRSRFHLQAGYSIPFGKPTYTTNVALTDLGHKQVQSIAPGGFIFGLGFSFE